MVAIAHDKIEVAKQPYHIRQALGKLTLDDIGMSA